MRSLLAGSLGLSLACWAGTAQADDVLVRIERPQPAAVLLPPATGSSPSAILSRPVAIATTQGAEPIRLSGFASPGRNDGTPLFRAQSADNPQPLPVGPGTGLEIPGKIDRSNTPVIIARRQNPGSTPGSTGSATTFAPAPVSPPSSVWGFGGGVVEGPVGPGLEGPGDSTGCGPTCGAFPGPDCCRTPRFWINGEYLLWWVKDGGGPPLVSMSPPGQNGVLPGAGVLFDGGDMTYNERSGARFNSGWWFGDDQCVGIDSSFFFLSQRAANFSASSPPFMTIARPFQDVTGFIPIEAAETVPGTITVRTTNELWGGDFNFLFNLGNGPLGSGWLGQKLAGCMPCLAGPTCIDACAAHCSPGWCSRLDFLTGFRYLGMKESLGIGENLTFAGSRIIETDQFETRNYFYGGQVGTRWELTRGRFGLGLVSKVALGATHSIVNINGSTTLIPPVGSGIPASTAAGGLFAQPTNIGRYTRDTFAVVPEVGAKLSYQVTDHLRLFVGYNFLYWSSAARPADQIDRGVNQTQRAIPGPNGVLINPPLMGPARPMFVFRDTDFWAHGASFGLELRY